MGTKHACIPVVSLGGVTAEIIGGSTGPSSGSAMGAVAVVTARAASCKVVGTSSKL